MGCCVFSLVLLGMSRLGAAVWWLVDPSRWKVTFAAWPSAYWIWPALGILFLPWTTLMYVIVYPGGISLINLIFLVLALVADIGSYGSGYRANAART